MNKVAIVTGSSRGIGATTALRLAKDGYDICIKYLSNSIDPEKVADIVRGIGVNCITVQDLDIYSM